MTKLVRRDLVASKTFINREVLELMREVTEWLSGEVNYMGFPRKREFFFLDMCHGYDGELGHVITIYHAKELED